MVKQMVNIKELSDFHINYAKGVLKEENSLAPMICSRKDGRVLAELLTGSIDRNIIKIALESVKRKSPEWFVLMHEGYERNFDLGFSDVKECVIVNTYTETERLFATFSIEKEGERVIGFGEVERTEYAEGYLI